jgi:hypothetical protein
MSLITKCKAQEYSWETMSVIGSVGILEGDIRRERCNRECWDIPILEWHEKDTQEIQVNQL